LVIEREGFAEDECALSCLDYCIRNLGLILKVCYSHLERQKQACS
jgi:hypothetical protein